MHQEIIKMKPHYPTEFFEGSTMQDRMVLAAAANVKAASLPNLDEKLLGLIGVLHIQAGWNISAPDKAIHAQTLAEDIATTYKHLTFEEVEMFLKNGLRGMYGEFKSLNIPEYHKWLKKGSQEAQEAKSKQVRHIATQRENEARKKAEPSKEEIADILFQAFKRGFETWRTTGMFNDLGNNVHDQLVIEGKITTDRWREYVPIATEKCKDRYQPKNSNGEAEKLEYLKLQAAIESGFPVKQVEVEAKKICLTKYFEAKYDKLIKVFGIDPDKVEILDNTEPNG